MVTIFKKRKTWYHSKNRNVLFFFYYGVLFFFSKWRPKMRILKQLRLYFFSIDEMTLVIFDAFEILVIP